jgi:PKD repeat protein
MINQPTPTQLIENTMNGESVPTQVVDNTTNSQPTPTQYIEKGVANEPPPPPTIDETLENKSTLPQSMWWWDDDFFYRQSLTLSADTDVRYDPTITQVVKLEMDLVELIMDDEGNLDGTKLRPDGEGWAIVYWDGSDWSNLPINVQLEPDEVNMQLTTTIYFPLQSDVTDTTGGYWFYYGNFVGYPTPSLIDPYVNYASKPYTEIEGAKPDEETLVNFSAKPVTGLAPFTTTFFYDAYPEPNEYRWDFGDGETLSLPGRTDVIRFPLASQTVSTITHTYKQPGVYTPTLTVITDTVSGLISSTRVYPGLIWVSGVDISDKVTTELNSDEETPVVTTTFSANPETTRVITSAEGILSVTFPAGALKETVVVSHIPYRASLNQGAGTLARFNIVAETLDGQPVSQPDQPMILTLDVNRFFDLSDAKSKALAETIMFFGLEEGTEEWKPLKFVTSDLEQGAIVFELDQFNRDVLIRVTGIIGGPPPIF